MSSRNSTKKISQAVRGSVLVNLVPLLWLWLLENKPKARTSKDGNLGTQRWWREPGANQKVILLHCLHKVKQWRRLAFSPKSESELRPAGCREELPISVTWLRALDDLRGSHSKGEMQAWPWVRNKLSFEPSIKALPWVLFRVQDCRQNKEESLHLKQRSSLTLCC